MNYTLESQPYDRIRDACEQATELSRVDAQTLAELAVGHATAASGVVRTVRGIPDEKQLSTIKRHSGLAIVHLLQVLGSVGIDAGHAVSDEIRRLASEASP